MAEGFYKAFAFSYLLTMMELGGETRKVRKKDASVLITGYNIPVSCIIRGLRINLVS